ncbi:hypothetical protein [uncultured Cutibacterium sp.]|uniref:hypothetical protein n=1 Tax=uncultured Cutibacterium sp. TaxID=1912223 RepID=UPI00259348C3|nr:hypothetical protein [uncultured Cutibacterium sp.]
MKARHVILPQDDCPIGGVVRALALDLGRQACLDDAGAFVCNYLAGAMVTVGGS